MRLELKAQEIAVELAAAVADAGITQAELDQRFGWNPERASWFLGRFLCMQMTADRMTTEIYHYFT